MNAGPIAGGKAAASDAAALADSVARRDRSAVAQALNLLDDRRADARAAASELVSSLASRATTARELAGAVPGRPDGQWQVPVQLVSATSCTGIEALAASFAAHRASLVAAGTLTARRRSHQARSVLKRLQQEFGTHGVARLGGADALLQDLASGSSAPLACHETLRERALSLLGSSGGRR